MVYLAEIDIIIKHYMCFPIGKNSVYFEIKKLVKV